MPNRRIIVIGLVAAGIVAVLVMVAIANRSHGTHAVNPRPPALVGQSVPATVFEIDFARRYDLHCYPGTDRAVVLQGCKIIGWTGPGQPHAPASPYAELAVRPFSVDHWLVVELPDGRKAYLPPDSIRLIEESPEAR